MKSTKNTFNKYKDLSFFKFLMPSFLGILLFMVPIPSDGSITIPIAILSSKMQYFLGNYMGIVLWVILATSATFTFIGSVFKPNWITKNSFLNPLFNVSFIWSSLRVLAFIFITFINLEQLGVVFPDWIVPVVNMVSSGDTGGMILSDLLPVLFCVFLFAGLFLPLLLDFGLLELIGSLLIKVMRPIFGLPGRSAIDCIASWLGDGTIGVLLTSKQYEEGFYTKREAAVIGTTFSLVSITFSLVVINTVDLGHLFVPFYLTVTIASLIAAIIMPKIPPLSLKQDVLYDGSLPKQEDKIMGSAFSVGLDIAVNKAKGQSFKRSVFIDGSKNVIDMWFGVIPVVMGIGTIALILATYTPLFQFLGAPFEPILNLLQIPEAAAASQTLVAGFADMLLPSILASSIESELTRFVIASVSVCQLIYLSEVGALLISSKVPVKLWELFIIFIERTLITLPIIALIAHIIF